MNYLIFLVMCNVSTVFIYCLRLLLSDDKGLSLLLLVNIVVFFLIGLAIVCDIFKFIFKRIFKKKKNTNYEKCWEKMPEIGCAGTAIGMGAKDEYSINSSDSDKPYYTGFCPISTDSPDEDFELKKKIERKKRYYRFK